MLPVAVPARSERTRCTRPRGSKCLRNEGTGTHDHVSYDAPVGIFNGRVLRDTPSHGQCLTCRCPKSPARMSALLCTHVRTRAVEPQSTSDIESTTCDVLCMTVSGYRDGGRSTDADCLDYLEWLRWPDGFVCPRCENVGGWRVSDGSFKYTRCKAQTAVTAGTLFDRRRTPLTVWFQVCWEFATAKDGVSALAVKRTLQIGSYQTAWAMLHRLRSVLIRPGRELLSGQVEVDETYIGGEEAGLAGGRARGKKALVAVAVEVRSPKGFGRCRMRVIPDGSARTLHTFITDNIAPGSTVITDGWSGYLGIDKVGYPHDRRSQRAAKALGEDIGKLLPGVHRIASLAKRWLLSTHQGAVHIEHLPGYLDEFCFRFNRRRSRSRGLVFYRVLQLAIGHDPVRYQQLIARSKPKTVRSAPPGNRGHPPSLDAPAPDDPGATRPDEAKSAQMDSPERRNARARRADPETPLF